MSKFLLFALLATGSGTVFGQGYGDAGCGFGSLIFGNEGGAMQILAATTNGSSGSQTFGITSGTANCKGMAREADEFITINGVSLHHDAAKGEGETVETLSQIFNCSSPEGFGAVLQNNYDKIFSQKEPSIIRQKIMAVLTLGDLNCQLTS